MPSPLKFDSYWIAASFGHSLSYIMKMSCVHIHPVLSTYYVPHTVLSSLYGINSINNHLSYYYLHITDEKTEKFWYYL